MSERVSPEHIEALAAAARLPLRTGLAQELVGGVQALPDDCGPLEEVNVARYEASAAFPI